MSSPISEADEDRVVALVRADVERTIGPGHDDVIVATAAQCRLYVEDLDYYASKVVEDVQQYFHDMFVDTTWPACPHHPNHPLWLDKGWWVCAQTKARVAALGSLRTQN